MAKLRGKAKEAFLARMARGRKKHRSGKRKKKRSRKRRHHAASPARARRTAPHRKHARKRRAHRARRSNPVAYLVNPTGGPVMAKRRKHRKHSPHRKHRRRHHRMNPGDVKGQIKGLVKLAIPAVAAGFVGNFVEAKFLGSKNAMIRGLARAGMAVAAGMALRKNPAAAGAAMGALLGPIGGERGTAMGGGLMLHSKSAPAAVKGLAEAIAGDEDMAEILKADLQGFGLILDAQNGFGADTSDMADGADMDAMAEAERLEGNEDAA